MKKLLALLMSVTMLMSLMSALSVPVSALGENEGYPLLYETYESDKALESVVRGGNGKGTVEICPHGLNGSAGALHVNQTSGGNYIDIRYTTDGVKIPTGQKVQASVWVKMNSALASDVKEANCVSLIFYGSGIVTNAGSRTDVAVGDVWNGNGWKQLNESNKLVEGEWVKVEFALDWSDSMSIGSGATIDNVTVKEIALRIAGQNGTNAVVDGAPLDYEVDDFVISYPVEEINVEDTTGILVEADYDNNTVTGELDGRSEDCSLPYHQVVYTVDGVNAEKGYIVDKQANASQSVSLKAGRMYKISGWYRFDADESATDFVADKAALRMIFYGKDRTDVNFEKNSNYPSYYSAPFAEGTWTKIEYYFYMDYRMYATNPGSYIGMRICPYSSYKGGAETRINDHAIPGTYSFDNIVVEDLGAPANGDMELDASILVVRNFKDATQVVPGWKETNVDVEAVQEENNTYLKFTTTTATYGNIATPYAFENNKTYRISFRAKAENLEDGVTYPFAWILDRKVTETGSNDAYTVPNYEYLAGGDKVLSQVPGEDAPWQISNQWQTFTTIYKPRFAVKEGMEAIAPGVNPRVANMYLYMYVDGVGNPLGSTICMDDVIIEELPQRTAPTVENITFTKKGSAVVVNYDYVPVDEEQENKSATLIRAFIDNGDSQTNIGTCSGNEAFTIPLLALGKEVSFEVIPVSETGIIGEGKSAVCTEMFDISMNKKLTVDSLYLEASYSVDVISAKSEPVTYMAVLAEYNKNGQLMDICYDALEIFTGNQEFGGGMELCADAAKIKLMLIDGESLMPLAEADEILLPAVNEDPFAGDDEINVVFLGDSLYAGSGASGIATRWVTQVGEWFKGIYEDEDTKVNWYNKGAGGTTSHYSLVRMKRDVLDLNPDIVFFATTSNDGNADTTREMESVIRTLQEMENPPYVVMTFFTNKSWRVSPGYGEKIAAHYGIPMYNGTEDLRRDIEVTGRTIEEYFADGTHPNDAGYEVIANGIIDWISTNRHFAKPYNESKLVDNAVVLQDATFINAEDEAIVERTGNWMVGENYVQTNAEGDELSFTFDGNFIAFEHGLHKNSGKYEVYVDGELAFTGNPYYHNVTSYMKVCKGDSTYLDLSDGTHAVTVKTIASSNAETTAETYGVRIYDIIVGTVAR